MKKFKPFLAVIILLISMGCEKPTVPPAPPPVTTSPPVADPPLPLVNTAPKVNAGNNFALLLPLDSAFLYGAATDADYNIESISWTQISGPGQAIIQTPDRVHTKITKLVKGEYSFELTVIDKAGLRGIDTAKVAVIDPSGSNRLIFLKAIEVDCWGRDCWALFDKTSTGLFRNLPIKVFLKSVDAAVWIEIPQQNYFFSPDDYFWIDWFDLDYTKKWEAMIVV